MPGAQTNTAIEDILVHRGVPSIADGEIENPASDVTHEGQQKGGDESSNGSR